MWSRSADRRGAIVSAIFVLALGLSAVDPGLAAHARAQGVDAATLDREEQAARQATGTDATAHDPQPARARAAEAAPDEVAQRDATPPKVTRYVVDEAGIIDPGPETALLRRLVAIEAETGHQLVVVTTDSLGGEDVADYARKLGDSAAIGDREEDDGVLFLIAPNERRMHIATGYGIEATLTDALAGRIIRNVVTPRFRAGDYAGGIAEGVEAIADIISLPPEEAAARQAEAERSQRARDADGSGGAFWFWFLIILVFVILPMFRDRTPKGGRRRRHYNAPIIVWGGPGIGGGGGGFGGFGGGGGGGFGGFSGGGGSFGGGGASGGW